MDSIVYYNENDPFTAAWLVELIGAGLIAPGFVDTRSIEDVCPEDLDGYTQCHFFAGIGGWSYALRLAGWPDDKPVWTGSCPCQPFSTAGKGKGTADERHLWPAWLYLIEQRKPAVIFGEQVASKAGLQWFTGVRSDLESLGFLVGAAGLCAYAVKAPHERLRAFWVANTPSNGREGILGSTRTQVQKDWPLKALDAWHGTGNPFEQWQKFLAGTHVRRMDDGVSSFVDTRPALRGYGNAIVPQIAAAFIESYMECCNDGGAAHAR